MTVQKNSNGSEKSMAVRNGELKTMLLHPSLVLEYATPEDRDGLAGKPGDNLGWSSAFICITTSYVHSCTSKDLFCV